MKPFIGLVALVAIAISSTAQFKGIVVEEVDNGGSVPGRTYRIYAELLNVGDQVYIVFGDSIHPLEVTSTKPFFQSRIGGAFSKDIQRNEAAKNDSLKYDSWLTIGAEDNYDNRIMPINFDTKNFEEKGGTITAGKDGGWFCYPTDKQAYCGEDRRILLMQLTTEGKVEGKMCIMGKTAAGEAYTQRDVSFTAGQRRK